MSKAEVFFYSPFSPSSVTEENNKGLLLQFILSEIFSSNEAVKKNDPLSTVFQNVRGFFPYDWANPTGHLNKAQEHASLLKYAFPDLREIVNAFLTALMKTTHWISLKEAESPSSNPELIVQLEELYLLLEPLIIECSHCENLIFFLLKHQKTLADICSHAHFSAFLKELIPEGLDQLQDRLCDHYQRRGFASVIPELKLLIENLEKSYVLS